MNPIVFGSRVAVALHCTISSGLYEKIKRRQRPQPLRERGLGDVWRRILVHRAAANGSTDAGARRGQRGLVELFEAVDMIHKFV